MTDGKKKFLKVTLFATSVAIGLPLDLITAPVIAPVVSIWGDMKNAWNIADKVIDEFDE